MREAAPRSSRDDVIRGMIPPDDEASATAPLQGPAETEQLAACSLGRGLTLGQRSNEESRLLPSVRLRPAMGLRQAFPTHRASLTARPLTRARWALCIFSRVFRIATG